MNIYINGEAKEIDAGVVLQELLDKFNINPKTVVVEKNEVVVPRDAVPHTPLADGDKIEIVRFVGGGSF